MTNVPEGWNLHNPPMDREIEVQMLNYIRAFYQSPHWWYVYVDSFGNESYASGPTPEVWKELDAKSQ